MTEEVIARLKELAVGFVETDKTGMRQRWEFGRALLPLRRGLKLPPGVLAQVAEATGVSKREIQYCLKFAEVYDGPYEKTKKVNTPEAARPNGGSTTRRTRGRRAGSTTRTSTSSGAWPQRHRFSRSMCVTTRRCVSSCFT